MNPWHPRAMRVEPVNTSAGSYRVDCPYKFVLHTVEGQSYTPSRESYYGHQSYPHFTVADHGIYQHFPIDLASRALYHPGSTETNAARAIQVEIAWYAGSISEMPDATMTHLADLTQWLVDEGVVPLIFAQFRGDGSYGTDAPQRFDEATWYAFAGICGHQHVPDNDHWDPGDFPVDRLKSALGMEEELKDDERAALFAVKEDAAFIRQLQQELKDGGWYVGNIFQQLEALRSMGAQNLVTLFDFFARMDPQYPARKSVEEGIKNTAWLLGKLNSI